MPVDALFFGAHPDDVEWGAGGIALLLQQKKVSFAIVDLTRGEMGSRGTPEERYDEALRAADFLGGAARENLGLPDGGLVDSPSTRRQIAEVIRQYQPSLVLAPYWRDRHPDHTAAGRMVRNSALYCTLKKSGCSHAPHKPRAFLYYLLHDFVAPSFVVDISAIYARKLELLKLHESQFAKTAEEFGVVPHGLGDYLYGLESRDRFLGSLIGVRHGEALIIDRPMALNAASLIPGL
jgi:bacillithiol biosynthesis deacetylase BshB1